MVARRASFLCTLEDSTQSPSPMTPFVTLSLDQTRRISPPTGDHKGPPCLPSSALAPTDHPLPFGILMKKLKSIIGPPGVYSVPGS